MTSNYRGAEWSEYEGASPTIVKLNIDHSTFTARNTAMRTSGSIYNSLRSHLEEIVFVMHTVPATLMCGGTGSSPA